jgi:ribulose-phosphate 3-epimerase
MSVNPGFGGQRLMSGIYAKIARLKQMIENLPRGAASELMIEIDGGVDPQNAPLLVSAGAEVLVSGSAFFHFPPYAQRVKIFQDAVAQKC